jgi:hypothetical protein
MNKELLFIGQISPEKDHVANHTTSLSTVGLDSVYCFGNFFHGFKYQRRRSGQPDRWRTISGGLLYFPRTTAGPTRRQRRGNRT